MSLAEAPPVWIAPTAGEWGVVLASYLIGCVPFGWLLAKSLKGVDLRTVGSGNVGATNAMRVLGRPLGILVFFLDAAKGALAILWLVPLVARTEAEALVGVMAGTAAVLGHCYSIFLGFGGGKGVATGCGALATFDPWIFAIGGLVWLAVLAATRWVALASIAMGLAFPIAAWWRLGDHAPVVAMGAALLALLILVRHRSNMARMLAGTEPRVFQKRPEPGGGR